MRVYLAAPYGRREELRGYRAELETACQHEGDAGGRAGVHVTVTSRWLDVLPVVAPNEDVIASNPEAGRPFAQDDVADVRSADLLVLFTKELREPVTGGAQVEFGLAIAFAKMLALVGPRINVFHTLEGVKHFHGGLNTPEERAAQGWRDCRDWILGGCK